MATSIWATVYAISREKTSSFFNDVKTNFPCWNLLCSILNLSDVHWTEYLIGTSQNTSGEPLSLEIRLKQSKKQLYRKKQKSLSTCWIIFHICNSNIHLQNFRWLSFVNFTHHGSETGWAWSAIASFAMKNYEGLYRTNCSKIISRFQMPPTPKTCQWFCAVRAVVLPDHLRRTKSNTDSNPKIPISD